MPPSLDKDFPSITEKMKTRQTKPNSGVGNRGGSGLTGGGGLKSFPNHNKRGSRINRVGGKFPKSYTEDPHATTCFIVHILQFL